MYSYHPLHHSGIRPLLDMAFQCGRFQGEEQFPLKGSVDGAKASWPCIRSPATAGSGYPSL